MGVGSLANETSDSHALRASGRATRIQILEMEWFGLLPSYLRTTLGRSLALPMKSQAIPKGKRDGLRGVE